MTEPNDNADATRALLAELRRQTQMLAKLQDALKKIADNTDPAARVTSSP
jgi:hypothetical protein